MSQELKSLNKRASGLPGEEETNKTDEKQETGKLHKVKRAIFLASGFGSRLLPLTREIPKPMVRVSDKRIIETLLDAVVQAGIEEIYIVRGYKKEAFDELLKKYPNIKFLENPYYATSNNISSVYVARDFISSAYVIEADLFLLNSGLIRPFESDSNYLGIPVKRTEDWYIKTDTAGFINEVGISGEECFQLVGISFWTESDGKRLKSIVEKEFEKDNFSQLYWDQLALQLYKDSFKLKLRPCDSSDVYEIDSIADLNRLVSKIQKS